MENDRKIRLNVKYVGRNSRLSSTGRTSAAKAFDGVLERTLDSTGSI